MNPTQILNTIPNIILQRADSASDTWILMILENRIQCLPTEDVGTEGVPLAKINRQIAEKGFSGRDWDKITNRIVRHQKTNPEFTGETTALPKTKKKTKKTKAKPETNEDQTNQDAE